jgi:UDP-N-acetylmuramoylalanine--D-glutamate ligase
MKNNKHLKVVVGLGKTGLSCVRFLRKRGDTVAVTDSRLNPPGLDVLQEEFPEVQVALGHFDEQLLAAATDLIMSPGVSLKEPSIAKQIQRGVTIAGDIELFGQTVAKPIVAITGSNGKSTVTSLVGHLAQACGLRVKIGGNLGIPVLELVDDSNTDLYVIELSSFQLETTFSLKCLSAVNLNISEDHMDRYDSLEDYAQAKLRIYEGCLHPVINLDDAKSYQGFDLAPRGFTLREPSANVFGLRCVDGINYLAFGEQNLLPTSSLLLKGQHQYANALAALAISEEIGLPMEQAVTALTTFQGLPHRCQWVANIKGVDWYNDSKATNVGSALAAIAGIGPEIGGKIIMLAGGLGKNADFSDLYAPVEKYVRTLILYGQDKHIIAKALDGAAPTVIVEDLACAIKMADGHAEQGDAVVLAPACASYDMFRDFEHRGDVFMEIVRGMIS